ncbi:MAG: TlpA family protein disulfide reductase [Elusimicrobiota bacterium]
MKKIKKEIIIFLLFITSLVVYGYTMSILPKEENEVKQEKSTDKAYNFRLKRIDKDEYIQLSQLYGKPIFIDFWASWCPPCRDAVPYVEKLNKKYGDKIHVLGLNLDKQESAAEEFLRNEDADYIQLKADENAAEKYKIKGIPVFYILDEHGRVVNKYVGFRTSRYEEWVDVINSLLK